MELSKEARAAKNAYQRMWRQKNKDKVKKYVQSYWEKQASQYDELRVKELHKQGLSLREIAAEVDISHTKVNRIIKKIGLLQ